jgi:hypothetical protein
MLRQISLPKHMPQSLFSVWSCSRTGNTGYAIENDTEGFGK